MTEQTIFLAALDIANSAERMAYLDEACAGDAALRRQVEALLTAHERSGAFLDVPAVEQIAAGRSRPDAGTVALEANAAEKDGGEENALAFLQPSSKPGSLGRLGHYEVLEVLGRGGFGIVLKAFDEMLHRVVAVKVLSPQLASTSPARKRFLREARAAAAIRHENVVAIHAVDDQPIPYLVMEFIAGETLQQRLQRVGPLDVPQVLRLGQQIASGLAEAHALGLIHRDVKPSNILLENGIDRVKITDFGLARTADDASLSQSGVIAGTPLYMAPEQAQGEVIDQRADLFSLGSVLYEMCSGRPPFRASTVLAVLKRVAEDTPRPIREIIPEVPEWLCAIVARLHAKKPADRFASAKEVAELLARYLSELHQRGNLQELPNSPRTTTEPAAAVSEPVQSVRPRADESPESGPPAALRSGSEWPPWLIALARATAGIAVLSLLMLILAVVTGYADTVFQLLLVLCFLCYLWLFWPSRTKEPPQPPSSPVATGGSPVAEPSGDSRAGRPYVATGGSAGARPAPGEPPVATASGSPPDPQLLFGLWGARTRGKPWPRSRVLLAVAMVLLVVLSLVGFWLVQEFSQPRIQPPASPKAAVVFRVEANQVWQDTGVDVDKGQVVVLYPQGTWRKGQQTCSAGGLERAAKERAVWTEGAPFLCLLARVGDEPAPTAVLQRQFFEPKRSDRLFVQANDLDLEGNNDSLQLTITGGRRRSDAAPPPGLTAVQAADRDWQPFLARTKAPGVKPEQVREEVFDYCQKYAGTFQAFRAGLLLRKLPLVNSIGMKLAPIPPGQFLMGSPDDEPGRKANEGPRHEVVITRPFYMGIHHVTVGQFKAFVKEKGYQTEAEKGEGALVPDEKWEYDPRVNWRNPGFEQTDDHPVVCVSWNDARAFCNWLSAREGKPYALPTEAQWEYCCRAGSRTTFYFGDDERELVKHAWYRAKGTTRAVGLLKANEWGLLDMHGNVWQWTADWFAADYYRESPREDPPGPSAGDNGTRVLRGGSAARFDADGVEYCRDARRSIIFRPSDRGIHIGFRVVLPR